MSINSNINRRDFILKLATLAGAISVALSSVGATAASAAELKSVRVNRKGNNRLILSIGLSSAAKYKIFALKKPERLVIDLLSTSVSSPVRIVGDSASKIRGMRHAIRNGSDVRLVLDMSDEAKFDTVIRGSRLDITLSFNNAFSAAAAASSKKLSNAQRRAAANRKIAAEKKRKDAIIKKQQLAREKALAKKRAATRAPQKVARRRGKKLVVAIDAGHGGKDPGAVGMNGTYEKSVVLQIARRLKATIDKNPNMQGVLTRSSDKYISLRKRTEIARNNKADLFVSIHADANPNRKLTGSSVYILSENGASSAAARFLAKKENEYDNRLAGANLDGKSNTLTSMLLDLSQSDTIERSLDLANNILKEVGNVNGLLHNRVESAGFAVLKSPDIPSMLVETAFISNPTEEKKLKTAHHQQRLASAIYNGIKRYQLAEAEFDEEFNDDSSAQTQLAKAETDVRVYQVKSGDTLSEIAEDNGIGLSVLRKLNNMRDNKLRVGQKLELPAMSS